MKISRLFASTILFATSFLVSNILYLSLISVLPFSISMIFGWSLRAVLLLISIACVKRYYLHFQVEIESKHLLIFELFMIPILLRFPMVYPTHDDLAAHFMLGDYAQNIWNSPHFMPVNMFTYFYPAIDMVYTPFLYIIGIRLTILLIYVILSIWMVSLLARWQSQLRGTGSKVLLYLVFIATPFMPHLMATHGTLMVDYFSLVLALESLYLLIHKKTDKTLGVIFLILTVLVKQSTSIFILPILGYYTFTNWKQVNWKQIALFASIISLYFIRLYIATGNPIMGLYNGVFHSPLFAQENFRDPRFGPRGMFELLSWPVIAQFMIDRYGEGVVAGYARLFFAPVAILGYLGSIYIYITKKKIVYLVIFLSYLLWSVLSGYSRYYIPLNVLALVILSQEIKLFIKTPKIVFVVFSILCLSSFKTDFSWRPYPSFSTLSANSFFVDKYIEGLRYVGRDQLGRFADDLKPLFAGYEAVVPVFRGTVTYFSYIGALDGLKVIGGYSEEEYSRVQASEVDLKIRKNQEELRNLEKILVVIDEPHKGSLANAYIPPNFTCSFIGMGPTLPYFGPDSFTRLQIYSCTRY